MLTFCVLNCRLLCRREIFAFEVNPWRCSINCLRTWCNLNSLLRSIGAQNWACQFHGLYALAVIGSRLAVSFPAIPLVDSDLLIY